MSKKSFGVLKQVIHHDAIDEYLEELSINGFTVVENILNKEELELFRIKLDEVYEKQAKEFSEKELDSINELLIARLPLAYDDRFIELVKKEKIISIIREILGNYFILNLQNGIINLPNESHHQHSWHRDLPYQDFVISHPLAISALYCLDDFDQSTGGTLVLPFSHKLEQMPSDEYIQKHAHQIIAQKGSVILFDSMVFHKAGYNSSSQTRRGVNHMFTAPILKQQINIPESLNGKFNNDPFLNRLLGYETIIPKSVIEWRNGRLKK